MKPESAASWIEPGMYLGIELLVWAVKQKETIFIITNIIFCFILYLFRWKVLNAKQSADIITYMQMYF